MRDKYIGVVAIDGHKIGKSKMTPKKYPEVTLKTKDPRNNTTEWVKSIAIKED